MVTLAEHYGIPDDESVEDVTWLRLTGERGWAVFMKDTRVRYNQAERDSVKAHGVRSFCLASQNLRAEEMAARFLANLDAITHACGEPGPFMYAVHETRIVRLRI